MKKINFSAFARLLSAEDDFKRSLEKISSNDLMMIDRVYAGWFSRLSSKCGGEISLNEARVYISKLCAAIKDLERETKDEPIQRLEKAVVIMDGYAA